MISFETKIDLNIDIFQDGKHRLGGDSPIISLSNKQIIREKDSQILPLNSSKSLTYSSIYDLKNPPSHSSIIGFSCPEMITRSDYPCINLKFCSK